MVFLQFGFFREITAHTETPVNNNTDLLNFLDRIALGAEILGRYSSRQKQIFGVAKTLCRYHRLPRGSTCSQDSFNKSFISKITENSHIEILTNAPQGHN